MDKKREVRESTHSLNCIRTFSSTKLQYLKERKSLKNQDQTFQRKKKYWKRKEFFYR